MSRSPVSVDPALGSAPGAPGLRGASGEALSEVMAFASHARTCLHASPADDVFAATCRPARGDHDLNAANDLAQLHPEPRPAAVLVPVIPRNGALYVILTLRAAHLPTHAGQIAFPGGKMEPDDADPEHTALREAHEEIGLEPANVTTLGCLDSYQTGTGFRILPVVATVSPGVSLTSDPAEVDDAFEVPLAFLMDAGNHRRHAREWKGVLRHYYAIPWENRYIWGATAGILRNLQETMFPT
ncbi:MAG: CoA pyrophosphatase [Pseudomonadota bacterium]